MAAPPPPPKGGGGLGLSLYANLLDSTPDSAASISRAPVVFKPEDGSKDDTPKKAIDPALRFQPIRRPQAKQPAKAAKPIVFPKVTAPATGSTANGATDATTSAPSSLAAQGTASPASTAATAQQLPARSTLADWAATEEDEYLYGAASSSKRQRGGRRRKKKKLDDNTAGSRTDWDELYDPARPTNVEEYLRSDERVREVREWKAVLYAHRRMRRREEQGEEDEDEADGEGGSGTMRGRGRRGSYDRSEGRSDDDDDEDTGRPMDNRFAPPPSLSFAPPPLSPPRAPPAPVPDDASGEDAYARRMALSSGIAPPLPEGTNPPPPPPDDDYEPILQQQQQQQAPPPPVPTATISRAPVRYEAPPPPLPPPAAQDAMDIDEVEDDSADDEVDYSAIPPLPLSPTGGDKGLSSADASVGAGADAVRTSRPGQAGFARRLMAKYGWTAGSGLGVEGDGIKTALRVQLEKRRRRPDAEGGGFAEPGGRGKIIGGKTAAKKKQKKKGDEEGAGEEEEEKGKEEEEEGGKFGRMSDVVVLRNMLENMPDLAAEVEAGLGQEIGEECGDKYGRVERLFIDVEGRQVFIKFTDQVSALRAVNALEGRIFNGNNIAAKFYDSEKFEQGIYR